MKTRQIVPSSDGNSYLLTTIDNDPRLAQIAEDIFMLAIKLPRGEISIDDLIEQVHELSTHGVDILERYYNGT